MNRLRSGTDIGVHDDILGRERHVEHRRLDIRQLLVSVVSDAGGIPGAGAGTDIVLLRVSDKLLVKTVEAIIARASR